MIPVDPFRFAQAGGGLPFELTWWQYAVDGDDDGIIDKARMGVLSYDAGDVLLASSYSAYVTGPLNAWGLRTHAGFTAPGAAYYRIVMQMDRLDGTENDAYIDDVALVIDGDAIALTNPGAEAGVTGWTVTSGALTTKSNTPAPHGGAAYFYGGNNNFVSAYQDVVL